MGKKYIIQKRELGEEHGKKPHLMGPYRTVYSEGKPPFELDNTDHMKINLLKRYGQGRYQVKSIGAEKAGEKSQIIIHFIGDVIDIKPYERHWTQKERQKFLMKRRYPFRIKAFTIIAFFSLFMLLSGLLVNGIKNKMPMDMIIALVMVLLITSLIGIFFINHVFYEVE